jgi:hypothetical protein
MERKRSGGYCGHCDLFYPLRYVLAFRSRFGASSGEAVAMEQKCWALVVVCAALDVLLVVSAVLAFVGAVCALGLIRSRDFVVSQHPQPAPLPAEPVGT